MHYINKQWNFFVKIRWDKVKGGDMLAVEDNLRTKSLRTEIGNSPRNLWVTAPPAPRASWKEPHHTGGRAPSEDTKKVHKHRFVWRQGEPAAQECRVGWLRPVCWERHCCGECARCKQIDEVDKVKIPIGAILRRNGLLISNFFFFLKPLSFLLKKKNKVSQTVKTKILYFDETIIEQFGFVLSIMLITKQRCKIHFSLCHSIECRIFQFFFFILL